MSKDICLVLSTCQVILPLYPYPTDTNTVATTTFTMTTPSTRTVRLHSRYHHQAATLCTLTFDPTNHAGRRATILTTSDAKTVGSSQDVLKMFNHNKRLKQFIQYLWGLERTDFSLFKTSLLNSRALQASGKLSQVHLWVMTNIHIGWWYILVCFVCLYVCVWCVSAYVCVVYVCLCEAQVLLLKGHPLLFGDSSSDPCGRVKKTSVHYCDTPTPTSHPCPWWALEMELRSTNQAGGKVVWRLLSWWCPYPRWQLCHMDILTFSNQPRWWQSNMATLCPWWVPFHNEISSSPLGREFL